MLNTQLGKKRNYNWGMANADRSPLGIHKRFATLERRVAKLESGIQETDRVIDPEGWIGEAFEVLDKDLVQRKLNTKTLFLRLLACKLWSLARSFPMCKELLEAV